MSEPKKARRKPVRKDLSDFGKAVAIHNIKTNQTMAQMEANVGLKGQNFRKYLTGEAKPPVGWVTNNKLPEFMRRAAAEIHQAEVARLHAAITKLVPDESTPDKEAA